MQAARLFAKVTALLLLVLFAPSAALPQLTTSRLDGTVKDQSGAVVPGASVTLTNMGTNLKATARTNESGLYVFPQVLAGRYRIGVEISGFKQAVVNDVKIEVAVPATLNIDLEVGGTSEVLQVSAAEAQPLLNTVNAEINTTVTQEQIQALPLNGRDPIQFALLQAGVTGSSQIARTASVNGTRGTFNNLTLDGINNQDNFIRTDGFFGVIPLRESFIQEFNLTTSNSEVDAGVGVAQTQLITRSGTNHFHGSAFYFHRNSALNSNLFFNNASGTEKPRVLNHQYGGNLAGPILKDKLFFFSDYEEERDPSGVSLVRTVLTPSARDGNFSYTRTDNGQFQTINLLQIAPVSADPAIRSLIGLTPQPNDSSTGDGRNLAGFRFNSPGDQTSRWLVLRLDYALNSSHSIETSFKQFKFDLPNDPFNDIDAVFPGQLGGGQASTRRSGTVAWRTTFSPTLTNEARWGFQYAPVKFFTEETFSRGYRLSIPLIDNPVRNDLSQGRKAPIYEVSDNAFWVRGNHTVKFGGAFRWSTVDSFSDGGIVPLYTIGFGTGNVNPLATNLFPGGISANDLTAASSLLALLGGFVDSASQVFNVTSRTSGFVNGAGQRLLLSQRFFSLYGSDTWRLRPNLTLTAGLRWEFHTIADEKNGLALLPVGGIQGILNPNVVIDFAGGDSGRAFFNNDLNNFSPNIGLAWQPFGNGKTVLRAGYAINYVIDNNFTAVNNAVAGNDGLTSEVLLTGLTGTVSSGGIRSIPRPEFKVPRTARDNIVLDPQAAVYTIDPNLRTPYVQQWTLSLQHELFRNTVVEARYVGNRGTKLSRAVDLNQVRFPQEFLDDFRRAQRNLAANNNPSVGEPLTVFPRLGLAGFLTNATVRTYIRNGEIGQYVGGFLAPNRDFFFSGEGGEDFGATLPISYFLPNPSIFVADYLGNNAFSNYHALQLEIRGRVRDGLHVQSNYTFGKCLTDFSGTQTNFRGLMDNARPELEILRPEYDITHTFNTNFLYEVPFGSRKRFFNTSGIVDKILGGWSTSGIIRLRSGETVHIVSQRGTINRAGSRSVVNTVLLSGLTAQQLQERTGAFRDSQGRVRLFDPSLISADGRANSQFFQNPGLLQAGTLGLSPVSGPWYFNTDLGLRKSTPLTESVRIEFRFDFYNLFNRTNFNISTKSTDFTTLGFFNAHNINNTSFGVIDSTFDSREMQFGVRILF